ncbi:MAG: hypothetical protein Q9160_008195 [Pyrenula sp. 1 TL-2023]
MIDTENPDGGIPSLEDLSSDIAPGSEYFANFSFVTGGETAHPSEPSAPTSSVPERFAGSVPLVTHSTPSLVAPTEGNASSFDRFIEWQPPNTQETNFPDNAQRSHRHSESEVVSKHSASGGRTASVLPSTDYPPRARSRFNSLNARCPADSHSADGDPNISGNSEVSSASGSEISAVQSQSAGTLSETRNHQNGGFPPSPPISHHNSTSRPKRESTYAKATRDMQRRPQSRNPEPLKVNNSRVARDYGRLPASTAEPLGGLVAGSPSARSSPTSDEIVWRHLIHTSCEAGHLNLVKDLINAGLDINRQDSAGNTPLHVAAGAGHIDIMKFLVESGCSVNAVNHVGWTAVHMATVKGQGRCVRLLLEQDANPWTRLKMP